MFKKLIKILFSRNKKESPSYSYFEDNSSRVLLENDVLPTKSTQLQAKLTVASNIIMTKEEKFEYEFYSFLFGESNISSLPDDLSLYIAQKIEKLLIKPADILESLPVLPASLTQIMSQVNSENFNTNLIVELLETEPAIAAKVVELANSQYYNRGAQKVTDIKSAFMKLGANGLTEGVINGFVSRLTPQSNIYFRLYGKKIWEHSLLTGNIAKQLVIASDCRELARDSYLLGLISNLGDVVIYQLMIEAFAVVHPDHVPSSAKFKELMLKKSKKLTYLIAKHWKLPTSIIDVLAIQTKLIKSSMLRGAFKKHPLACYVYEAKLLAELEIRIQYKHLSKNDDIECFAALIHSKEATEYLNKLYDKS